MTRPRIKNFTYIANKKYDGMMGRCYRTTDKSYHTHGGRGIKVVKMWIENIDNFKAFLLTELDRINVPVEEFVNNSGRYVLDRVNNDGHYGPNNCRLVSVQANARNGRSQKLKTIISAEGDEICVR